MRIRAVASKSVVGLSAVGVLVIVGGVWAIASRSGTPAPSPDGVLAEYSVENLKKVSEQDPGKMAEMMGSLFDREDLTEEQRREIRRNMERTFEDLLDKNINEYYAAQTDEEKTAVLDRQIDQFQERMKLWEERRREREAADAERSKTAEGEKPRESREERGRRMWQSQSRDERKARSESRDPEQSAKRMAYFAAAMKRAGARGISMPMGPGGGGGRGPGGGGPGSGRG